MSNTSTSDLAGAIGGWSAAGSSDYTAPPIDYRPNSIIARLFQEPGNFDFFQAVSLIDRWDPRFRPVGTTAHPERESLRFRAALGAAFPPAAIRQALPPVAESPQPELTVALLGLTGPSGILPRRYTELVYRLAREAKGPERHALRDWLDLFNHRLLSLFYRAWEKYRFTKAYEREEHLRTEPDAFTAALFSLAGLGIPDLRGRLQVTALTGDLLLRGEEVLAKVDDLALLRYGGLLTQRPRTSSNLRQILQDYFGLPARIEQFQGQWLVLNAQQRTMLSGGHNAGSSHNQLGGTAVAGTRVWDVNTKFRVRVGPLSYQQFIEMLPDDDATTRRKTFFLLCHLVRLFVGPEFDFSVQLVLRREDVPNCRLVDNPQRGPYLGWNSWLSSGTSREDVDDAQFESAEVYQIQTLEESGVRL